MKWVTKKAPFQLGTARIREMLQAYNGSTFEFLDTVARLGIGLPRHTDLIGSLLSLREPQSDCDYVLGVKVLGNGK